MKLRSAFAVFSLFVTAGFAAPFEPLPIEDAFGVGAQEWRFASTLSFDANGVIELCYVEEGSPERVIGRVTVRPFRSSNPAKPQLRLLFTKAEYDGKMKAVLILCYGIRSGTFIVDLPNLTRHSPAIAGSPQASPSGEYTLLGYSDRGVMIKPDGMENAQGRLFFRYVGTP